MLVAIRRSIRISLNAGQPLEDLGVRPDELHKMCKADLMESNFDLISHAFEILYKSPSRQLDIAIAEDSNSISLKIIRGAYRQRHQTPGPL